MASECVVSDKLARQRGPSIISMLPISSFLVKERSLMLLMNVSWHQSSDHTHTEHCSVCGPAPTTMNRGVDNDS